MEKNEGKSQHSKKWRELGVRHERRTWAVWNESILSDQHSVDNFPWTRIDAALFPWVPAVHTMTPGPALSLVPRHHQQRGVCCTWFKTLMRQPKALKPTLGWEDFPAESQSHQTEWWAAVGDIKVKIPWGKLLPRDSHNGFRHETTQSTFLSTCITAPQDSWAQKASLSGG